MTQSGNNRGVEQTAIDWGDGSLSTLFARNRAWARSKTHDDPGFFTRLVGQQRPKYFWIGCSDSRVPATEIVDLDPGEMFVHRNVANLANPTDSNFSAALQFAVEVLEVEHVIVVGHYGCGGIQAAMDRETQDEIGRWLAPVRTLHHRHTPEGHSGFDDADALCERNVADQVNALAANPLIQSAWERQARLTLHGWIYALRNGLLQLVCAPISSPRQTVNLPELGARSP